MNDKEHDGFVDQLLDASLRRYTSEEPRAGLETRILAGVRASERRATRRVWAWSLAATAAVAVIVGLALYLASHRGVRTLSVPQIVANKSQPPALGVSTKTAMRAPVAPVSSRAKSGGEDTAASAKSMVREQRHSIARAKRSEQFPTPTPLTEQEKLLLLYVAETPRSVLAAQSQPEVDNDLKIDDLRISILEIKPLSSLSN